MSSEPPDEWEEFLKWLQAMMREMARTFSRRRPDESDQWEARARDVARVRMYQKHLPDTIPVWPEPSKPWEEDKP